MTKEDEVGTVVVDDAEAASGDDGAPRSRPEEDRPSDRRRRAPLPRMLVLLCALVVLPIVVSTATAIAEGWTPVGDNATIALRAGDVLRRDPPLTGMPSTSNTITERDVFHPGPFEAWLAAIPYAALGPAGLLLTVAFVNAGALVIAVVVGWRRGGPPLAVGVTAVGIALCWSLGSTVIRDPLNSHMELLPWFALVLLCWDIRLGAWSSLPVAVAFAAWVGQGHVVYLPLSGVLVLGTVALCVVDHRRRSPAARRRFARGRKQALIWGTAVAFVLTLPLLIDQVAGTGNLGRMLAFTGEEGRGLAAGVQTTIVALGAPPAWLRGANDPFFLLRGPTVLDLLVFAVTVGLVAWVAVAARRRDDHAAIALLQAALLSLLGAVLVLVRTPLGGAVLAADPMLLLRPVTAVVGLAVGWGLWQITAPTVRPELAKPPVRRAASAIGLVAALALIAATATAPPRFGGYGEGLMDPMARLEPVVRAEVAGQPMVQVNANGWAARLYLRHALIEDLERHGIATRTDDDDRVFRRAGDDRAAPTATLWVVTGDGKLEPPEPDAVLIARTDLVPGGSDSPEAGRRADLRRQLDAAGKIELRDTDRLSVEEVSREFFRWDTAPPDQNSLPSVWVSVDSFLELSANGLVTSPTIDPGLLDAVRRDQVGRYFAAEDTEAAVYLRLE